MSVYRRGAVYWWCRRLKLGSPDPRSIMLRLSLKTSDKAEARSRALALDMELKMVVLRVAPKDADCSPQQWGAIYKEALEAKRDDIARVQGRPPFDDFENLQFNTALAQIFSLCAQTAAAAFSDAQWDRLLDSGPLSFDDQLLMKEIAEDFGLRPVDEASADNSLSFDPRDMPNPERRYTKAPVAPGRVINAMKNAGVPQTPENVRLALATMSGAYAEAFLEANSVIKSEPWEPSHAHLPSGLAALLRDDAPECGAPVAAETTEPGPPPDAWHEQPDRTAVQPPADKPNSVGNAPSPVLTDLRISEVVDLITTAKLSSKEWKESAERNAASLPTSSSP